MSCKRQIIPDKTAQNLCTFGVNINFMLMKSLTLFLFFIIFFDTVFSTKIFAQNCAADTVPPVVRCKSNTSINIVGLGTTTIWASDFLEYALDDCTKPERLQFAVSRADDTTVQKVFPLNPDGSAATMVTYSCSNLGPNRMWLWAKDLAGNAGFCEVNLHVGDLYCNCDCAYNIMSGTIQTETNKGISNVDLNISATSSSLLPQAVILVQDDITDEKGFFNIASRILPSKGSAIFRPQMNTQPLNGVSTLDLALISRHILGIESLSSPYKIIAADVNHSGSVTTLDIVALRRLILGVDDTLAHNTSWRFVPKNYVFPNPINPFQDIFPETIHKRDTFIYSLHDLNFIGVKTGDVNNSAQSNWAPSEDRTLPTYYLETTDRPVAAGEVLEVRFAGSEPVIGHQFSLEYSNLMLLDAEGATGNMNADNFAFFPERQLLTSSWNIPADKALQPAFTLRFRALTSGLLSDMLHISDAITPAEAYRATAEKMQVALRFQQDGAPKLHLYPNFPNPFSNETHIRFFLPEADQVLFSVYDGYGRLVLQRRQEYPKGKNTFVLREIEVPLGGIYLYKIETAASSAVGKMIKE
jgi:hypothetical protein